MNYVKIMGGLGNQLFEYTFAKYLQNITGKASVLYTDVYGTQHEKRSFVLDRFECDYIEIKGSVLCDSMILEYEMPDDLRVDRAFFAGFWQDKRYYNELKDSVVKDLSLKQAFISDDIKYKADEISKSLDSVALHIRRGDYLEGINTQVFVSQSMDYYRNALRRIVNILGYKPKVYIFSDDYEYISMQQDEYEGCQIIPMKPGRDYEDLYLMSCATHHIIANSSFSWWGAALSKQDGITIMPDKWFKDRQDPDLAVEGWMKI